jgi:chorismate mutase/prephenate dehydratase
MDLQDLRRRIDGIDAQLVALLNERQSVSIRIGLHKRELRRSVYDPERERELLAKLKKMNTGPLTEEALLAIYGAILDASHKVQESVQKEEPA